jgi:hypothetical protein
VATCWQHASWSFFGICVSLEKSVLFFRQNIFVGLAKTCSVYRNSSLKQFARKPTDFHRRIVSLAALAENIWRILIALHLANLDCTASNVQTLQWNKFLCSLVAYRGGMKTT